MKKLLGIMVLGLLLSGNANGKIIKFEQCFNPDGLAKSHKELTGVKEWSFTINLETTKVVSRLAWTKEEIEKENLPKFMQSTYNITNYDNEFIYASNKAFDGSKKEISLKVSTGEIFVSLRDKTYILQCKSQAESGGNSINGPSSGTAFFVSKKGHLITNNHVVKGCSISKITYQNKDYDTKLIATDKTLDLALLKAELRPKSFFNFSKDDVKKLNKVYVAGYPLGKGLSDDLKISSGIVSSLKGFQDNSNEIQIDAPINPGNSGGPIINENGDLIAIAVSGLAKDQTEGINFGIKSSAAELFLRSNKVTPKKAMYSGIKDNDKLLEILEEGTVYTYCE